MNTSGKTVRSAGERAAARIDAMIADILEKEGGFVDHPADRGGPTNFGVTQQTLGRWLGRPATREEVRDLDVEVARQIFRQAYFGRPKLDRLPDGVQPIVFDMCVLHGPGGGIRILQQALCDAGFACAVDGGLGDETAGQCAAAWQALSDALLDRLVDARIAFCEGICERDPSQEVFLQGWKNRANSFRSG